MIAEVLSGLNIIEKVGKFVDWIRKVKTSPAETISSRFIRLFEAHGVHRNQIPRFFGHGLTLRDVQDDESLLDKLDEPLLEAASSLFGVRREWLEGAETRVYSYHDFYKHPEGVAPFLEALKASSQDGSVDGILIAPEEKKGDALVVISETVGEIGGKSINRYHLCNNWVFEYWKSRAYLTAFVATSWKHGIFIRGIFAPSKEIEHISTGESLLIAENVNDLCQGGRLWYPEDMALKPEDFLSGVDPEQQNFGLTSALQLWLTLEKNGYMATGLSMYQGEEIRRLFEQARAPDESRLKLAVRAIRRFLRWA